MRSTRKKEEDLGVRTDGFDNHFKRHYPRNLFAILVGWSSSFSIFLFFLLGGLVANEDDAVIILLLFT